IGFAEIVSGDFPILHAAGFCLFCSPHGNDKVIVNGSQQPVTPTRLTVPKRSTATQRGVATRPLVIWHSAAIRLAATTRPAGLMPSSSTQKVIKTPHRFPCARDQRRRLSKHGDRC